MTPDSQAVAATSSVSRARSEREHPTGRPDIADDLILPVVLFVALGAMTWAVRGSSGFGAVNGCVFAGVTWGAAWWFISRDSAAAQSRRYSSGWIILALTVGIGISGNRGWMQWPSFFEGHLQLNTPAGRFAPIPRIYGFIWLFIAGVPWAGLGSCLLAWCAPARPVRARDWAVRLGCGIGGAAVAAILFHFFPQFFLPLFSRLKEQYADLPANPNLRRLMGDNRAALIHLGCYLGLLGFEALRRDWKNAILITTVGVVNGLGWAVCQNWRWAQSVWPQANFNWWRCWESCGGMSIGLAYGLAYYFVNRGNREATLPNSHPNWERFGAYLGLVLGLGLSVKNGLKGWANIYLGNEEHWDRVFWRIIGPLMLCCLGLIIVLIRRRPVPRGCTGDLFPHDYRLVWLVLITQNLIAQMVTGPHTVWNEMAFKIYYVLLLVISGTVVHYFRRTRAL